VAFFRDPPCRSHVPLIPPIPLSSHRSDVQQLLTTLQLLQQTAQVKAWLEQQPHHPAPSETPASWRQRLQEQRERAPGKTLFLDQILAAVTSQGGVLNPQYPPPSAFHLTSKLFPQGSPASPGFQSKLCLLLYFLKDAGWDTDSRAFAAAFHLPPATAALWECYYLLDAWNPSDAGDTRLATACRLLQATANPKTPFRVVEVLLAAGEHRVALAVQRARGVGVAVASGAAAAPAVAAGLRGGGGGGHEMLMEQQVLLRLRLRCGLLEEGLSGMREHLQQVRVGRGGR
jgi:hypothetical protein